MAYVNVSRDYYNSMNNQARTADMRRKSADSDVLKERQRLEQLAREGGLSASDLSALKNKIDSASKDLQDELESLRVELGRQLGKQALENQRVISSVRQLAEANKRSLEKVNRKINILEKRINAQVSEIAHQLENDRKQALFYYDQLAETVNKISSLFPDKYEALHPENLQPGYYVMQSTVAFILDDIDHKDYEAAISLAQTRIQEAVNMLAQLEFYHTAFLNAEAEVKAVLSNLMKRVRKMAKPKKTTLLIGRDSEEYEDVHGITYWAREFFEEITQRISDSNTSFDIFDDSHDTEGLMRILEDVNVLNEQLSICEHIEENERKLHFECVERVAQIYNALNENDGGTWDGFEWHFNEEDLREPVYATIINSMGHQVVIACIPDRSTDLAAMGNVRCEIEVYDKDGRKDDLARCDIIYKNIVTVLSGYGLAPDTGNKDRALENDSKTFIGGTNRRETELLTRWIGAAQKAIGLLEEE